MGPTETIRENLGEEWLLDAGDESQSGRPALAQRDTRRIVLYLHRRTIGPFVNRHDDQGDTIRCRIDDRDHIRVPPRKWKSMEKLRGLQLGRAYDLVPSDYLYNEVEDSDQLNNPMSVVFGDSVTSGSESAGIPSLAVYEQGISVQEVRDATERLTHNSLGEAATMWSLRENEFRTTLFDTLYVQEDTDFLQSITLDVPVPEALCFLLMCLDARRYGAGKQVLGANMENRVLGILATDNEPPVTPYTIVSENGHGQPEDVIEDFKTQGREWGTEWMDGETVAEIRQEIRTNGEAREDVLTTLGEAADAYHSFVYG